MSRFSWLLYLLCLSLLIGFGCTLFDNEQGAKQSPPPVAQQKVSPEYNEELTMMHRSPEEVITADPVLREVRLQLQSDDRNEQSQGRNRLRELLRSEEGDAIFLLMWLLTVGEKISALSFASSYFDHPSATRVADALAMHLDAVTPERFGLVGSFFRKASPSLRPHFYARCRQLIADGSGQAVIVVSRLASSGIFRGPYLDDAHRDFVLEIIRGDYPPGVADQVAKEVAVVFDPTLHVAVMTKGLEGKSSWTAGRLAWIFARDPVVVEWWEQGIGKGPLDFIDDPVLREQVGSQPVFENLRRDVVQLWYENKPGE